jgi:hypothetical protein
VADDQRVSTAATESERIYERLCRAINAHDWDAVADCVTEDYESDENRMLGWEPLRGPEGVVGHFRSWVEIAPDAEFSFEWLGGDDEHPVVRFGGSGHAADAMGGGAFEYFIVIVETVRDGRFSHGTFFELGDEAAAFAHLADLQHPAHRPLA